MEAIEALARVNVLCLDKTGTITTGELSVEEVLPVSTDKNDTLPLNTVLDLLAHVLYAFEDDNATGTALKQYLSSRTSYTQSSIQQDISASVPFSSRRKFTGVTLNQSDSYVLGAPDFLTKNPKVCKQAEKLSAQGLRVLLLASCKELADSPKTLREVTPVAIITLTDCIKENAPDMFHFFETQGVQVKIISGDNPATVSAVGVRAGIPGASNYVDTASLEGKSQEELTEAISRYTVFGRVSPEMKQRIVKAFQNTSSDSHKKGRNVVGMVGDGVNDVLALKDADCAIAMANGADAARHAAHIVLMDSDFSSMKEIVREGRTIIANIERVSALYLTKTLYSILLCVLFIILGKSYPFTPIQLTLIGATAIGIPSFLLALEHHEEVTTCGFLKYVLRISLPAALLLTAILAAIQFIAPVFSLSASAVRFLNLLLGGIVSLGVVVRVCMPMNRRRFALCIGVTALFFGALLLMPEVFGLR
jgi:cation-transporting ATPase E